jgi:hypothetical protein
VGQQYGHVEDGHEIDEVIFLLAGYQVCRNCGSQLTGISWRDCVPSDEWREAAFTEAADRSWGSDGLRIAYQHNRYNVVNDRVQKELANGRLPGLWQNPSL